MGAFPAPSKPSGTDSKSGWPRETATRHWLQAANHNFLRGHSPWTTKLLLLFRQVRLEDFHGLFDLGIAALEEIIGRVIDVHVRRHAVVLQVGVVDVPQSRRLGVRIVEPSISVYAPVPITAPYVVTPTTLPSFNVLKPSGKTSASEVERSLAMTTIGPKNRASGRVTCTEPRARVY